MQIETVVGVRNCPADPIWKEENQYRLNHPAGICADLVGNLYVTDYDLHVIRKIDAQGKITILAGKCGQKGFKDGLESLFYGPYGILFDRGHLLVSDTWNHSIRRIDLDGVVSTLGSLHNVNLHFPTGLAKDSKNNIYIVDNSKMEIKMLDSDYNNVTKISLSNIKRLGSITVDSKDRVYIADIDSHRILRSDANMNFIEICGSGHSGNKDGSGNEAQLSQAYGMAADDYGNVLISDFWNGKIRIINGEGKLSTLRIKQSQDDPIEAPHGIAIWKNSVYFTEYTCHTVKRIFWESSRWCPENYRNYPPELRRVIKTMVIIRMKFRGKSDVGRLPKEILHEIFHWLCFHYPIWTNT
eukprot:TRINITY_DN5660_c0_g1_i1.p1 TRINITY_DN5660_c0_g1~~TRINITY_DN5660_c0_g1_i1.p1  ORF type:complete len:355 (+),score=78.49 TRINITY_DN5660_c0_g1_i1:72-1136(+)